MSGGLQQAGELYISVFLYLCISLCDRQENIIAVSENSFPPLNFIFHHDFWLLAKKLYHACDKTSYKRAMLNISYPTLCQFFDRNVYGNSDLSQIYANPEDLSVEVLSLIHI